MRKMLNRLLVLVIGFGVLFSISFAAAPKVLTIGLDIQNQSMTWPQFAAAAMKKKAAELGVNLVIYDSQNDVAKQTANMEDLIAQKVDGIIANPLDVNSLTPAINKAADAGIPVATFDRAAKGSRYSLFVGCDDVVAGRLIADFVAKKLGGKGKIILLTGTPGASPAIDRTKGFKDQLKKYPGLTIAFDQTAEFYREKGLSVMEDAITAVPKFNAVVCQNDDMMLGAIQALKSAGLDRNSYIITGNDGIPDALKAIKAGDADCTVQFPIGMATEAFTRLVNLIRGHQPKTKDYLLPPWVITKDNLKTGDFYSLIQ